MIRFLPLLLFLHFNANAQQASIVKGRIVPAGHPISRSTVLIALKEPGKSEFEGSCSGSLLSDELVVTAAHCVTDGINSEVYPATAFLVQFSNYDGVSPLPNKKSVFVRGVVMHPLYKDSEVETSVNPHDIALLRLDGKAKPGFRPARWIGLHRRLLQGTVSIVAGFGNTSFTRPSQDSTLRSIRLRIVEVSNDSTLVGLRPDRPGGIGGGDSGGPAFVRINGQYYLWGVASTGEEEGRAAAAYENLQHYKDWLESAAALLGSNLNL